MNINDIDPLLDIPDDDPIVLQIIEKSLAPFRDRLTPEQLEDRRLVLALFLTSHPEASRVVDSLRPRAAHVSSGEVLREGSAGSEPAKKDRAAGGDR